VSETSLAGAEVTAGLSVQLGRVADLLEAERRRKMALVQCLRQAPFAGGIPLSGGAGTLQQADLYQAKPGYTWSIRRATATGFSAGTVTVYKNVSGGEILWTWPTAGTFTFGRGEQLLEPMDQMIFVASGITGTVQVNGTGDLFESWLLADYII